MPQKPNRADFVAFGLVIGGFVLAVASSLAFGLEDRALGAWLVLVGAIAVVRAQSVAVAKEAIGERWPLWPGKNTLRPFTVRLWAGGVLVLGFIMLAGL
jgi:hypothetical protein